MRSVVLFWWSMSWDIAEVAIGGHNCWLKVKTRLLLTVVSPKPGWKERFHVFRYSQESVTQIGLGQQLENKKSCEHWFARCELQCHLSWTLQTQLRIAKRGRSITSWLCILPPFWRMWVSSNYRDTRHCAPELVHSCCSGDTEMWSATLKCAQSPKSPPYTASLQYDLGLEFVFCFFVHESNSVEL